LGEVITLDNSTYEKTASEIIEKYGLELQKKSENEKKWPKGTALFKAFNSKYCGNNFQKMIFPN